MLVPCNDTFRMRRNEFEYIHLYNTLDSKDKRNYSSLSLTFIASSFRVSEENLVFETVQSGPYSSFECFLYS